MLSGIIEENRHGEQVEAKVEALIPGPAAREVPMIPLEKEGNK